MSLAPEHLDQSLSSPVQAPEDRYQRVAFWMAAILCAGALLAGGIVWVHHTGEQWQNDILREHYAALVGLPWAAAASFILITLFRQVAGPIKIRAWGLVIEGAGGPVLLWIACFMAITTAISMVWGLKS